MDIRQQSSVTPNQFAASKTKMQQVSSSAALSPSVATSSLSFATSSIASSNLSASHTSNLNNSHTKSQIALEANPVADVNRRLDIDTHAVTQHRHSSAEVSSAALQKISAIKSSVAPSSSTVSSSSTNHQFSLKTGPMTIGSINPAQISPKNNASTSTDIASASSTVNVFAEQNSTKPVSPFNTQQEQQVEPIFDTTSGPQFDTDEEVSERHQGINVSGDNQQTVANDNTDKDKQDAIEQVEKAVDKQQQKIELAEQQQVDELAKRDVEVKTHEQAHKAVGGMFAQSPSFSYEKGPDGKRYAVDGEVQIDVSVVNGDPQATYNKMQKVYAAAMAPVQPSGADIRVAAEAVQKMNQAKAEMAQQRQEQITPAEDIQHINELANTYKQTNEQADGFQQSQLEPFSRDNDSVSDPKSRFIDKINEQVDTQTPQVPNATLAYLSNKFSEQTPEFNTKQPTQTFEFTV